MLQGWLKAKQATNRIKHKCIEEATICNLRKDLEWKLYGARSSINTWGNKAAAVMELFIQTDQ